MRSVSVLVLLTAAAGTAAGVLYLPEQDEPDARVQRADVPSPVLTASAPRPASTSSQANRVLSAQTPLFGTVEGGRDDKARAERTDGAARTPPLLKPTTVADEPGNPPSRADAIKGLAGDLQRELKRVGCYAGDNTGEWDATTRRAMRTFLDRVNAKLPVQQPDHILLTMVKGHPSEACGKGCPAGHVADEKGACSARVVANKVAPRDPARISTVAVDTAPSVITGSIFPAPAAPSRVSQASSWTTEIAPTVVDAQPLPRVAGDRSTALPGRMSLGSAAPVSVDIAPSPSINAAAAPGPGVPRGQVKRLKAAAATSITPSGASADDTPSLPQSRLPSSDEGLVAPRPKAQLRPQPNERPTAGQTRKASAQSSVPSYNAPTIRAAPRRDWKAAVFDQNQR